MQVVNKHWHKPTGDDLYVGRGSILGNPFANREGTKALYVVDDPIASYRVYLWQKIKQSDGNILHELTKITDETNLVCYCAPKPCHAEVIVKAVQWLKNRGVMSDGSNQKDKIMKVLTLTQPWASLVAIGAKKIETRSWTCQYRGSLLIHAAKGFPRDAKEVCLQPLFRDTLAQAGIFNISDLPIGVIIASCKLVDIKSTNVFEPEEPEYSFGNYSEDRYAWMLEDVKALTPVAAKGALGLWEYKGEY